jgi:hypothetical protein
MLSENEIERVARLVRLAPYMDQEMRGKLLDLVRDLKAADAAAIMPQSAIEEMAKAVPDKLVREIVDDHRHGRAEPGFLKPSESAPVVRGSGWVEPVSLGNPPGIKYVDQLIDVQDAVDKRELEKRLRGR